MISLLLTAPRTAAENHRLLTQIIKEMKGGLRYFSSKAGKFEVAMTEKMNNETGKLLTKTACLPSF